MHLLFFFLTAVRCAIFQIHTSNIIVLRNYQNKQRETNVNLRTLKNGPKLSTINCVNEFSSVHWAPKVVDATSGGDQTSSPNFKKKF